MVTEFVLAHEQAVRLATFCLTFSLLAGWEFVAPRRPLEADRAVRWTNNLGLAALNSILVRLLLPIAAVGIAAFSAGHGTGLLNRFEVDYRVAIPLSVLTLDLAIYLQHRMFHAVPLLWRLHRVHHADLDVDVTTGTRFHTMEILLSMLFKFAVILALGAPVVAVVIFEVLLNVTSMFNHANVRIRAAWDRWLRWVVVTPDMHRVHHSIERIETDSNFGFNLPWWDRVFGTYRAQPRVGHDAMTIGLKQFRSPRELWLDRILLQPFRDEDGRYAVGTRSELAR